jgi:4-oxalocrotonate tautomerase
MPLVRIDLPSSAAAHDADGASLAVHQALVDAFGIPPDDRFQVIARHGPGEVITAEAYMGVHHTPHVVVVQITCAPGRAVALKQDLYRRIVENMGRSTSFRAEDVVINLVESNRENWSFGGGLAQYVN